MFKRIFALLFVVVLVALAVAAYYLRDPNQFKQDLQDLAAEQSGYKVTINGDIHWRWALPFGVSAEDIAATADNETITVDRLTLGISFGSVFAAFDDWRINTLHLQDVYWEDSESIIRVSDFHLQDFRTGAQAPLPCS
ncbi:MAG: AsmA family protein [Pseudomonadota bacterium]